MRNLFAILLALACSPALALDCSRQAGSLPNADAPVGVANSEMPIENIVIIMQENHSFDNYFGELGNTLYKGEVDGIASRMSNPGKLGRPVLLHHAEILCMPDPDHSWNAMHQGWNGGKNDGFVARNGKNVMTFFNQSDLSYYYALADQFAISDRYFASVMTQTYPNRMFLWAGTSGGHIHNDEPKSDREFDIKSIFDELDEHGITWKYYHVKEDYLRFFGAMHTRDAAKIVPMGEFKSDIAAGRLPQVAIVESSEVLGQDEHPAANIQVGQAWVGDKIDAVMRSAYWPKAAVFLTLDEGGGFFDHVPPPEACAPDERAAMLLPKDKPGDFKRYGFRVPFTVISPYAKQHFVSHHTYDHTSILKFIETKFNLPALTRRDANADGLAELFDFKNPKLRRGPIPPPMIDKVRALKCPKPI